MLRRQLSSQGRSICKKLNKRAVKHQILLGVEEYLLLEAKSPIVVGIKETHDMEQFCLAGVVGMVVSQVVEEVARGDAAACIPINTLEG